MNSRCFREKFSTSEPYLRTSSSGSKPACRFPRLSHTVPIGLKASQSTLVKIPRIRPQGLPCLCRSTRYHDLHPTLQQSVSRRSITSAMRDMHRRNIRRSKTPAVVFSRVGHFVLRIEVLSVKAGKEIGSVSWCPRNDGTEWWYRYPEHGFASRTNQ